MLGTHASRRVAAVACLLATAGIGRPAHAQLTPAIEESPPASLVADCDFSISGCGIAGGELYGVPSAPEPEWMGGPAGTNTAVCGLGWKLQCRTLSAETCAQWVVVEGSGKVSFSATSAGVGGSLTQVCGSYVTNTVYMYVYS